MRTVITTLLMICVTPFLAADEWPQFRGAGGVSVGDASIPDKFDDQTNVAWKIEMPAKGASSPIVVDDKVIVTCSGGENQDQLYTVCIDANSGKELWTQKFWATGRCFVHPLSANAAPTPASDGKHIFAFYSSNDLACLDMDGNLLWYRGLAVDYPKAGNDVGMASSPVVKNGVVVVQVECQGDSFAMGLDAETGTTIWKMDRAKEAVWTSPITLTTGGKDLVVLQSKDGFDVVNMQSGEIAFQEKGETSSVSSPATANGKLYVPINGTTAYGIGADGTISKEWNSGKIKPSSMSSVIDNNKLYILNRSGVLTAFNAADGSEQEKLRVIKGGNWSTPVIASGHMYFFSQGGTAYVVKLGEEGQAPKVVHEHTFEDEVFLGSPAISNNAMFVRSDKHLWKIAAGN